jgi:hypothetical protein
MLASTTRRSVDSDRPLVAQLRDSLRAARGDARIRERLRTIVAEPSRLDAIVRELGPRHALVRELLQVVRAEGSSIEASP